VKDCCKATHDFFKEAVMGTTGRSTVYLLKKIKPAKHAITPTIPEDHMTMAVSHQPSQIQNSAINRSPAKRFYA
jgi:hypothetical protein